MLLALDPGIVSPGVALFDSHGQLLVADRVKVEPRTDNIGSRWHHAALDIRTWLGYHAKRLDIKAPLITVVYERPQIYTWAKAKGNPNDLIGIAAIGAAVAGFLNADFVVAYEPADWTGQIAKVCPSCDGKAKKKCLVCHGSAWETPRGRYIHGALTPTELKLVPDQNDAIDAVGIGLFELGRLKPKRVYSNGRD